MNIVNNQYSVRGSPGGAPPNQNIHPPPATRGRLISNAPGPEKYKTFNDWFSPKSAVGYCLFIMFSLFTQMAPGQHSEQNEQSEQMAPWSRMVHSPCTGISGYAMVDITVPATPTADCLEYGYYRLPVATNLISRCPGGAVWRHLGDPLAGTSTSQMTKNVQNLEKSRSRIKILKN